MTATLAATVPHELRQPGFDEFTATSSLRAFSPQQHQQSNTPDIYRAVNIVLVATQQELASTNHSHGSVHVNVNADHTPDLVLAIRRAFQSVEALPNDVHVVAGESAGHVRVSWTGRGHGAWI